MKKKRLIYCRGEQSNEYFQFDWIQDFSSETNVKLQNGNNANFVVRIFLLEYV